MKQDVKAFTCRLPVGLAKRLKVVSAVRGEHMENIVSRALSRELSKYDRYEALKAQLRDQPMTAVEYEECVQRLADECGV